MGLVFQPAGPGIDSNNLPATITVQAATSFPTSTLTHATLTPESEDPLLEKLPSGITLDFWHPWSGEMSNLIDVMVEEFNGSNEWGITVNPELHSDEIVLIDDFNRSIEDEISPEIIAAPGFYLRSLEESGFLLQDLEKFAESRQWGFPQDETDSFLPVFWNADILAGKRIGMPAYQSGYFIFYNQTWAKELGFSQEPKTPEDFGSLTCRAGEIYLQDNLLENNGTGGWVYSYNPVAFYSWLKSFRSESQSEESITGTFEGNENVENGIYLYDLFLENCAWIGRQQQPYEYFSNRLAIAYSGKMEDILTQERVNELNESNDQWSVIPYPSKSGKPVLFADGESYAITTDDEEHALAAWIFIRWMLSPENQVRMVEESGTFPLSGRAVDLLKGYKNLHPAWAAALDYLPLIQITPQDADWGLAKEILADISWKLIQYTTKREDIPVIFQDAQRLLSEITN